MTRLLRSKSCTIGYHNSSSPMNLEDELSPFEEEEEEDDEGGRRRNENPLVAAIRKSLLVSCSVDRDDVAANMDIGWPSHVSHVAHVTFDRVNGSFLGLPLELQPEVPYGVPSARSYI